MCLIVKKEGDKDYNRGSRQGLGVSSEGREHSLLEDEGLHGCGCFVLPWRLSQTPAGGTRHGRVDAHTSMCIMSSRAAEDAKTLDHGGSWGWGGMEGTVVGVRLDRII